MTTKAVRRRYAGHVTALAALSALGLASLANGANAQTAKDLVGSWVLVSNQNISPDGTRTDPYGSKPEGILMFDASGRYSIQVMRSGQPKFASGDRTKGTDEENRTTIRNNNPHFGKYTVDEANHVIVFKIEHAMFPNWEGTEQKRNFTIKGDELKYTVTASSLGVGTGEVIWQRAK